MSLWLSGDTRRQCSCTPPQIQRCLSRISGPLLDRIDIQVEVPAVKLEDLEAKRNGEDSSTMAARVATAREVQARRCGKAATNATLTARDLETVCALPRDAAGLLRTAMKQLGLSARSRARVLKLSRTLADPGRLGTYPRRARGRGDPVPGARPQAVA